MAAVYLQFDPTRPPQPDEHEDLVKQLERASFAIDADAAGASNLGRITAAIAHLLRYSISQPVEPLLFLVVPFDVATPLDEAVERIYCTSINAVWPPDDPTPFGAARPDINYAFAGKMIPRDSFSDPAAALLGQTVTTSFGPYTIPSEFSSLTVSWFLPLST